MTFTKLQLGNSYLYFRLYYSVKVFTDTDMFCSIKSIELTVNGDYDLWAYIYIV